MTDDISDRSWGEVILSVAFFAVFVSTLHAIFWVLETVRQLEARVDAVESQLPDRELTGDG